MLASWSVPPDAVGRWASLLIAVSWQLAALALLAWLCERALRLRQARMRHALWWFVLAAPLLLAPGREILQQRQAVLRVPVPAATARVIFVEAPAPTAALRSPLSVPAASVLAPAPRPARPRLDLAHGLGLVWLAGCAVLVLRLAVGHRRARRLLAQSAPVAGTRATETLSSLCAQARVTGNISLRASADIGSPVLYGWRHPTILLPESWLSALSDDDLRAMLAHEVAHVRRRDFLASSLQRALEIPLFFHPGAWFASRRIALAREELCDAWALSAGTEAGAYARSLTAAAERARGLLAPVSLGIAESRFTLLRRVEAIMTGDGLRRASRPTLIAIALLGLVAAAAFAAVELGGKAPAAAPAASTAGPSSENAGSAARRMEAELKTLATAVLMFVQDNGGQFPQATSTEELRKVLAPYLRAYQVPRDRIQYLLPAGVRVGAIETPAVTPMLRIDDRPDFAVVAYADGEVQDEPKGEVFAQRRVVDFVVLDENGQPAAGAAVKLVGGAVTGHTDQSGRLSGFEFRDGSEAAFYVTSADGTEDALPSVMFMGPREAKQVVLHRRGGPADMVQLSGRVLDPAGRPVAGATLWMRGFIAMGDEQDTFVGREVGTTDAQGQFSVTIPRLTVGHGGFISGWRDPWTCQVIAHKPGYGLGWVSADGSARIEGLAITLSQPAGLRGQVMDAEGRLLPEVPVGVAEVTRPGHMDAGAVQFREFASAPTWASTRTDKQGRFSLTDLPADGSIKLDITTCGAGASYRAGEMAPELGAIQLSEQRGELMVKLRTQPVIEGVLLTPERKPAEGVKVMLAGPLSSQPNAETGESAVTDKNGHYEIPMTVGGTWTVWVSDPKYFAVLLEARKVDIGEHVTIPTTVLQRGASIRGRVLDARTGAPVASVPVMCSSVGPSRVPMIPTTEVAATTKLDGSFEIGGPPGKVRLFLAGPPSGYTWNYRVEQGTVGGTRHVKVSDDPKKPSMRIFHAKSGQVLTGMDLFVAPEATVTGEVLGPDGRPWQPKGFDRGGHVSGSLDPALVTSTVYPPLAAGMKKPDGTFTMRYFFGGVPAVLQVIDEQDGVGGAARVTPEVGAANHVTIRMSPLALITGRVLMPDGSPAVGAYLGTGMVGGVATTDKEGRFSMKRGVLGLPATVFVRVPAPFPKPGGPLVPPKYEGESKPFEAQPGQREVDVGDIVLKPYRPRS